jgi:hypothetical protein
MIKHVGKHNNKKIVLLFRQVPNEEHMALLVYSDTLPRLLHDEVMKALESPVGQNAKELSEVLFRTVMADGRNCLQALHQEGFIKKVPTSQVLITPTTKSTVRLDELNEILNEMSKGEEAVKRLQEIDKGVGLTGKKKASPREVGMPPNPNQNVSRTGAQVEATNSAAEFLAGALSDGDLAQQRLSQAEQMQKQAEQLLAEAKRLTEEANQFLPANNVPRTTKKTATKKKQAS